MVWLLGVAVNRTFNSKYMDVRARLITGTYLFICVLNFRGLSQLQKFNREFFPIYGRFKDPWSLVHTFLSHAMGINQEYIGA